MAEGHATDDDPFKRHGWGCINGIRGRWISLALPFSALVQPIGDVVNVDNKDTSECFHLEKTECVTIFAELAWWKSIDDTIAIFLFTDQWDRLLEEDEGSSTTEKCNIERIFLSSCQSHLLRHT